MNMTAPTAYSVTGFALITGAASGIGRETGFSMAEAGVAGIVFADRNEQGARAAAEESKCYAQTPSYRAIAVAVDVTDPSSVQEMVDQTMKEFGRIDYNVNSAGVAMDVRDRIYDASIDEFDKIAAINTKGTMLCMRAVSKAMLTQESVKYQSRNGERDLGRGCIVNLGSVNSYIAGPKSLPYISSKFAVLGMTKAAAFDCRAEGIRVNAVCPSFVSTPMMQHALNKSSNPEGVKQILGPVGRMAMPEEVAGMIIFLCSPASSYINGTGLLIDAGMSLTSHLS